MASHDKNLTLEEQKAAAEPTVRRFDPADLLSPKTKRTRDVFAEESNAQDDLDPADGQSNLLERLHNVGKRESNPYKRAKPAQEADADADAKAKAKFSGSRGSGILGEEIKRLKNEGAQQAGPAPIDLTADDDEDEVQFVKYQGNAPDPQREVCLGTINATIMADRVPAAPNKALGKLMTNWPPAKITLQPQLGANFAIDAIDGRGNAFGKLDFQTSNALSPLFKMAHLTKIRLVTILDARKKDDGEQPGQAISKKMDIRITLYANAVSVERLGRHLSQRNVFLRPPAFVDPGKEVINPHVPNRKVLPNPGSTPGSSRGPSQYGYKERTTEEIKSDVLGMFDRLIKNDELPEMEANTDLIKTELMSHQKQALHFLTKQETPAADSEPPSTMWKANYKKDGTRTWYHVITGQDVRKVDLVLGGIFADMMGLGKTLSILSRICTSIAEARSFGRTELPEELQNDQNAERNTKGTLIVCPKSVLSNWDEQIKAHLNTKKISYYVYHGPKREQDINELAKYDIVITAYTTVGAEFGSNSGNYTAINRLNWFRVVLDEAHMIRNQDTNVFKSACAILSQRRWAVTGTPIQNRLDDLGALIKFLKVFPFHQKGAFEQHFLAPFKHGDADVISRLHLLVGSMTLRRTKEKIDLPERHEFTTRLEFSDSERALYEAFAKDSSRKINALIGHGERLKGRSYAHVLVNITRLRLLCAHGRELLSDDDMKLLAGTSWDTAIDLGEESAAAAAQMTEEQVYDTFYLLRESALDYCWTCNEPLTRSAADDDDYLDDESPKPDIIGYLTPCLHLFCPRCMPAYKAELRPTRDNYATCPRCDQYNKAAIPPVLASGIEADLLRRQNKRLHASRKGTAYSGPHTKVKALLADLQRAAQDSIPLVEKGEPPIRSVVFSGWTQYLDLIELALSAHGIGHVRLDGRMSVAARGRVLERFRTDDSVTVLVVSIKAGGQGLNFTAASRVFMMEPQFNPGVEDQAVDRVHRLGQRREVVIKKFIMAGSFEEKIVELQRKKKELASMATTVGRSSKESLRDKMESLRSLFR